MRCYAHWSSKLLSLRNAFRSLSSLLRDRGLFIGGLHTGVLSGSSGFELENQDQLVPILAAHLC